jgi:spore germination protein GerM
MRRLAVTCLAGLTLTIGLLTLGPASAENRLVPQLPPTRTTVYFLAHDRAAPIGVRRSLQRRSPYAREALLALLAGPTAEERRAGITSAIPPSTEIRSLSFRGDVGTGAVVDFSSLPATGDGVERARVITQITRTLIGVSGIERVWLRSDGRPWGFWSMEGGILDEAWSYDRLLGLNVGAALPGTEAVTGDYFSAVP